MDKKISRKTFNFNYLSAILIYIWAGAFLILTPGIKDPESRIFPYAVSIFSIVLATLLVIKNYFNLERRKEQIDFSGSRLAFVMAFILVIYTTLIHFVGFYIITPFYLYLTMWILGQRNKKTMLIISLILPIGVFVFFEVILNMEIPKGVLLTGLY